MRRILDLRPELNRFVMQLKYKDRTTFLRIYDDQMIWPNETEVAAAFKRLLMAKLPKVAFLTGNMERSIFKKTEREYQNLTTAKPSRYALINQGFDVDTLTLETQDVPADVSILVIADPKQEFSEASLTRLKQYIANGGNLLIACEPAKNSPLLPLLKELGVQLMQGQVIQEDKDYAPNQVRPNITPFAAGLSKYLEKVRTDTTMEQPVAMYGVAGLTWSSDGPFKVDPLLTSDPKLTWNRIKDVDLELTTSAVAENMPGNVAVGTTVAAGPSAGRPNFNGTISFAPQDGDVKGPITTAISLTRKVGEKEQRVVVTGDADFMRNYSSSQTNFLLSTALFRWLSYNAFPIDSYRPARNDTRLTVTSNQIGVEKTILLWGLPAALVAFASILLIRRKRK
jgi:ABC-2 type transport system permease protein